MGHFGGSLAAILDFVVSVVLQLVSECPQHCYAGIFFMSFPNSEMLFDLLFYLKTLVRCGIFNQFSVFAQVTNVCNMI